MTSVRRAGNALVLAIAPCLLSCDGSNDDGPTGSTGSFTISVSPATASIQQSGSTYVTVTLTRSGGFSGAVTLTISGSPEGVSATMDPAVLSGNTVLSRIDLTASASAVPGTPTVTITGTSGTSHASATFALSVTAAPDYALSVPATTVAAGATSDITVSINRANFTGGVTLALVNPPAGITGTFSPAPSTTNSALLSLGVGPNVSAGLYPLTIRGTASGLSERTTSMVLTVTPASTANNNVEYQFCQQDDVPAFFAYQDGSGPWQAANGSVSGGVTRFGFKLTTGRGGILIVYPFTIGDQQASRARAGSRLADRRSRVRFRTPRAPVARRVLAAVQAYETLVFHGSTAELAEDGVLACTISPPPRTIRGTVTGLAQFQYSVLSLGGVSTIFQGGVNTNPVTFDGVEGDLVNFMGSRLPATGAAPDRAVVFRNLNIPDGGTLPSTIDFNGPASFVPASAGVTLSGASGDRFEVYTDVITAIGVNLLWNDIGPSTVNPRPWAGLPDSRLGPGELHNIIVFASAQANSPDFRVAAKYVGSVSNQSVTFGPAVNPATVSQVNAGTYPRFRFQGTLTSEYNKGVIISVDPGEGTYFSALATSAWLAASGSATSYDLTMPDVASLPGFPTSARLKAGLNSVTTEAFGFTGPGTFEARPVAGTESKTSIRTRTIDVP
jgi:hypothetical protein